MPRALRIEFPGAIYHIINHGDRREPIFRDDRDHVRFLVTLGEACAKTGWRVHAFSLLRDHFHLVVETPDANLVAGMKWFLSNYASRFNRRHQLTGRLFAGRYKSPLVEGSGQGYLRAVCDYVHLKPARAGLLQPGQRLRDFPWSSWPAYLKPPVERPRWLRVDRVLDEHGIPPDDKVAPAALEQRLEQLCAQGNDVKFERLERGWCFGSTLFRRELLERVRARTTRNHHTETKRETDEDKARHIVSEELDKLHWTVTERPLYPKGDVRKILIAQRLRAETAVTLKWIARELHMGTWTHVSNRLHVAKQPGPRSYLHKFGLSLRATG